jgi:heptosyltransferase-3
MCSLSIGETAALYKCADLLITIDSMSVHLASAIGIPQVSLFGPTNPDIWGPHYVKSKVVVMPDYSCVPCGIDGCGGGKISYCLEGISLEQIMGDVNFLLNESRMS